jgi:hypothetical protein
MIMPAPRDRPPTFRKGTLALAWGLILIAGAIGLAVAFAHARSNASAGADNSLVPYIIAALMGAGGLVLAVIGFIAVGSRLGTEDTHGRVERLELLQRIQELEARQPPLPPDDDDPADHSDPSDNTG